MSSEPNTPIVADVNLKTTKALPAANASNVHDAINLEQTTQYATSERMALQVSLPATPSLADTKTVTLTVTDSADGVTFAAIPELSTVVATGASGAGAAAITRTFPLPGTVRQYIRVEQAVAASGGDNTAVSVTAQLLIRL